MKRCSKCEETKPRSEFHRNGARKDGLQSWCKGCWAVIVRKKVSDYQKKQSQKPLAELLPTASDRVRTLRRMMKHVTEIHGTLTTPCWIRSVGARSGYSKTRVRGKMITAHRLVWWLLRGSVPEKPLQLNHRCNFGDGRHGCVRPDHMYVGTNMDNHRDRKRLAA